MLVAGSRQSVGVRGRQASVRAVLSRYGFQSIGGRGRFGQSSRRAPSTAASSVKRWVGSVTSLPVSFLILFRR